MKELADSPTGRKFSLELTYHYSANGRFAKFIFRLLLYFKESLNDNFIIEIQKSKFANI